MAVTGIRKTSSTTFLVLAGISLVVFAVFLFGGHTIDAKENKVYNFTDLLLYWMYALGGIAILTVLGFVIKDFVAKLAANPGEALKSIAGVLALVALLVVTYLIGDDTPLKLNEEAQKFNSTGWLKVTDMWIYSVYVLLIATTGAAILGAIKSAFNR
ncbi:MAG: hypothetical protein SOW66_06190 [Porphyromonas sp.]|nr:hypothetical protein [Porphyromonas sp.]